MKIETSFEEFKALAKSKRPVVISAVIQIDQCTPISLFERAYHHFGHGLLVEMTHDYPHKIFMGFEPRGFFQVKNQCYKATLDGEQYAFKENVLEALRKFKDLAKVELNPDVSRLTGGIFGLVSYEATRLFEEKLNRIKKNNDIPEFLFYSYKINLIFNPEKKELVLSIITSIKGDLKQKYYASINSLKELHKVLKTPLNEMSFEECKKENMNVESDVSDNDYQSLVKKAKTYIQQGEIFQVVLSRSFIKTYQVPPLHIYGSLRKMVPAPYLFYMDNGENIILGASPEKLVSVKDNDVETVPIAGTCKDLSQDSIDALLKDEKELAEHMMLVDLARNDLGKVCVGGSVQVKSLLEPKRAGNLIHLTTLVIGKLTDSFDALDALKAVFPVGTVSGAPKIRAMEIIDELEKTPRGFYAGAFCFIDNFGNLDSALIIRTMILKDGVATVRAGAGIVFDSVPEKEAKESEAKALSILRSIQISEEGNGYAVNY